MNNGMLDVLNVGTGHLTFRFDKNDTDETTKAKAVITDMLRRGYMLFVRDGNEQKRVRAFDPATEEYILEEPDIVATSAGMPLPEPGSAFEAPAPSTARTGIDDGPPLEGEVIERRGRPRGKAAGKRLAMKATQATGIGPTAGG